MAMSIGAILLLTVFLLVFEGVPLFFQKRWKDLMIVGSLVLGSLYVFFGYYDYIPYVDLEKTLTFIVKPMANLLGLSSD